MAQQERYTKRRKNVPYEEWEKQQRRVNESYWNTVDDEWVKPLSHSNYSGHPFFSTSVDPDGIGSGS